MLPESSISLQKWLILGLKAEKQLRNRNHTEDSALGYHSRDNGHVTHNEIILMNIIFKKSFTLLMATGTTPFFAVVSIISENNCS